MLGWWGCGDSGCVLGGGVGAASGVPGDQPGGADPVLHVDRCGRGVRAPVPTGRNVLGVAVQLCTLPWLGFVPDDVAAAPAAVVGRLSQRLGIAMGELRGYGEREQTRTDHLREVAGVQPAGGQWNRRVEGTRRVPVRPGDGARFAEAAVPAGVRVSVLVAGGPAGGDACCCERVAAARARARAETWSRVRAPAHRAAVRRAGPVAGVGRRSRAGRRWPGWVSGRRSSSPAAVKAEVEKLTYLRRLDAHTLDLSMLPAERRRFLAGVGRRLTGQALSRREPERRYPILLTLLAQSAVDVLDETLLLFDQAISGRESAAKAKVTEALAERARRGEDRQALLDEILPGRARPRGRRRAGRLAAARTRRDGADAGGVGRAPRAACHAIMGTSHAGRVDVATCASSPRPCWARSSFAGGPGTEDLV